VTVSNLEDLCAWRRPSIALGRSVTVLALAPSVPCRSAREVSTWLAFGVVRRWVVAIRNVCFVCQIWPDCQPNGLLVRVHDVQMRGSSRDLPDDGILEDFESFFRREYPRLLTLAVALIGDREVACEVVQESLLRTFDSWPRIVRLERPGGWTRRVLVNLCTDFHRRRGREQRALAQSVSVHAVEIADLPSPVFWDAVRKLPRLQRSVVVLYYVDDLSVTEVAAVMSVSAGSVKTSLSRARASLAPSLAALNWEER